MIIGDHLTPGFYIFNNRIQTRSSCIVFRPSNHINHYRTSKRTIFVVLDAKIYIESN